MVPLPSSGTGRSSEHTTPTSLYDYIGLFVTHFQLVLRRKENYNFHLQPLCVQEEIFKRPHITPKLENDQTVLDYLSEYVATRQIAEGDFVEDDDNDGENLPNTTNTTGEEVCLDNDEGPKEHPVHIKIVMNVSI